jgi:hypothetical protein
MQAPSIAVFHAISVNIAVYISAMRESPGGSFNALDLFVYKHHYNSGRWTFKKPNYQIGSR